MIVSKSLSGLRASLTTGRLAALGFVLVALSGAQAQEPVTAVMPGSTQDEIRQFCGNIADAARDQRYLMQKQELDTLQAEINERITLLEERRAEYEEWLKRRNDFMQQAEVSLVDIYKTMKADAAAPQLQETPPILAAAIIMKLPARQSGLIMAEMDPKKAGIIASIMASAADPVIPKDPS
ncbi:MotE family protein [Rhizobiaceae bacterium BDR2-2]|uniref:MotE family protein n=1 Tax=Ectorhizobium quercum TaxID=2965071 RepID=A0AAE3MXJ6_9HYPH|nr:MotE family protein [Ectorhizobium quercum]MCX8996106.1 MotE family protein [Ectorhizobium quercum]